MNLRSINHNLLPVLLALLQEQNVSRAAIAVGLSQPAVSKALAQLRAILNDPLLIKTGRKLVLSRRGEELLAPVSALCRDLEAVWRTAQFDPMTSEREFVIAGTDYCAMLILPGLMQALAIQAPKMRLRFVDMVPELLLDDRSHIDFVIAPSYVIPKSIVEQGCTTPLFTDDFVTIVASDHRLAGRNRVGPEELAQEIRVAFGHDDPLVPGQVTKASQFIDAPGRTVAIVPQFLSLPMLVSLTGAVATVPRRLAELISARLSIDVLECEETRLPVEMMLAWIKRFDADADHRWFRSFLTEHNID